MNNWLWIVRRESWQHRGPLLRLPLILAAVLLLVTLIGAALAGTLNLNLTGDPAAEFFPPDAEVTQLHFAEGAVATIEKPPSRPVNSGAQTTATTNMSDVTGLFIGVAWIAAFWYLLGCLQDERRDKSILFWKSLPTTDAQEVLAKLFVGAVLFTAVAVVIAWLAQIVLALGMTLLMLFTDPGHLDDAIHTGLTASVLHGFFLQPVQSILNGIAWGVPLLAYALFCSAIARRSPFLTMAISLLVLIAVEAALYQTGAVASWVGGHTPFRSSIDLQYSEMAYLINPQALTLSWLNLLSGWLVAAVLVAVTILLRGRTTSE